VTLFASCLTRGDRQHRSDSIKLTPHHPRYKRRGLRPLITTGQQGLSLRSVTPTSAALRVGHTYPLQDNLPHPLAPPTTYKVLHQGWGEDFQTTYKTTILENLLPSLRLQRSSYRISINAIQVAGVRHRLASSNKGATSRVGGRRRRFTLRGVFGGTFLKVISIREEDYFKEFPW